MEGRVYHAHGVAVFQMRQTLHVFATELYVDERSRRHPTRPSAAYGAWPRDIASVVPGGPHRFKRPTRTADILHIITASTSELALATDEQQANLLTLAEHLLRHPLRLHPRSPAQRTPRNGQWYTTRFIQPPSDGQADLLLPATQVSLSDSTASWYVWS